MSNDTLLEIGIPLGLLFCVGLGYFFWVVEKTNRLRQRIARATHRKAAVRRIEDAVSLRRKSKQSFLPFLAEMLPNMSELNSRLERAGIKKLAADTFVTGCAGGAIIVATLVFMLGKPLILGILLGLLLGVVIPHFAIGFMGTRRVKKFLLLFPDAIDFIVRGLRSGLPVTESMNMVGAEMEEPVGSIFADMGEAVRLGVSVEKALYDTSKKLGSTEFNFFVTSIVLQRETGGNLSEILNNLSDVLRKRFMMRMKIKAMSSEAKASAIIVGSLPFVVIIALTFVSPGYLNPLVDDTRGEIAAGIAGCMLLTGVGIMTKMARFEI